MKLATYLVITLYSKSLEGVSMEKVGLVLEGGGMRGVYTSGVLDHFMEEDLYFPYVIGVSAGACNALSYISRQVGRSREINVNYASDKRYINYRNLLKGKGIFNMDFLFNDIPNRLVPFDYEAFHAAEEKLVIPTTDCQTGQAHYFEKEDRSEKVISAVKASSSLPLVGKMVELDGKELLDGGIADPIPIKKSVEDGNEKHVIILTRPKGYQKKPFRAKVTANLVYSNHKNLVSALEKRHEIYNQSLRYIEELEAAGKAYVIRPQENEVVKRTEKDPEKLQELYLRGYNAAISHADSLKRWLYKDTSNDMQASGETI